jgi:predicted membrane-bound spermidine synthase
MAADEHELWQRFQMRDADFRSLAIHGVFALSGVSALLYQLVWQRSLMMIYGTNIESVAMVVAAFLVGLGLGSIAGGEISKRQGVSLVLLFAAAELFIGLYGLVSLRLFHWVGAFTLNAGTLETGLLAFGLVFVPTVFMGATLPMLVAYRVRLTGHVGRSVSWLYFVNTLGAAAGAFLAAFAMLGQFGLSGTIRLAVVLNLFSAATVLAVWRSGRERP